MTETATIGTEVESSSSPRMRMGAVTGVLVVLGFIIIHDALIVDIWWDVGPMLCAGAVCGFSVVWSYRRAVRDHATRAWIRYTGLYGAEMIALGVVSLAVLRPRFTMAEAMVMDDAMAELTPPALPLMVAVMIAGAILFWLYYDRRPGSPCPDLGHSSAAGIPLGPSTCVSRIGGIVVDADLLLW